MDPWLLLLAILAFIPNASAVNQFRRPAADGPTGDYSENPVYEVGKEITFLWDTDFDQIDLVVWSDASDKLKTSLYKRLATNLSSRAFTWKPGFDGFPAEAISLGVFYLTFYQAGTATQAAQSHYFNVTQSSAVVTTSASSLTSPTAAPSSTTAATATTNPVSTTAASSFVPDPREALTQNAAAGLSAGAVAGIAIGAALGTLILCAGGFLAWRRHQRKKGSGDPGYSQRGSVAFDNSVVGPVHYVAPLQHEYVTESKSPALIQPVELGDERPAELSTERG